MYIIEGNIGAGKSTFLSLISQHLPNVSCHLEPVDNWASQQFGQSLLEKFYTAPERWAYTIETLAMICRSRDHMAVQKKQPLTIVERSIYSGHYCFALNGKQAGYFSELEWDLYMQWVDFLFHKKCALPHGIIYLKTDPEICHARIAQRSRDGESHIELSYLERIHERHESFLINKEAVFAGLAQVPVLELNGNGDFASSPREMKKLAEKVAQFMSATVKNFADNFVGKESKKSTTFF